MFKEFLIVGMGSFLGGGLRFVVSKVIQSCTVLSFPFGTFAVNIIGCLLIGIFSGLNYNGGFMSANTKLILTTGFCGGFTTFSTFMNENTSLLKEGNFLLFTVYLFGSILCGGIAVIIGHQLVKAI